MQLRKSSETRYVLEEEMSSSGQSDEEECSERDEEEYEVERIADITVTRGKVSRVLIEWKNYSREHDTWETMESLNMGLDGYSLSEVAKEKLQKLENKTKHTARRRSQRNSSAKAGSRETGTTRTQAGTSAAPPRGGSQPEPERRSSRRKSRTSAEGSRPKANRLHRGDIGAKSDPYKKSKKTQTDDTCHGTYMDVEEELAFPPFPESNGGQKTPPTPSSAQNMFQTGNGLHTPPQAVPSNEQGQGGNFSTPKRGSQKRAATEPGYMPPSKKMGRLAKRHTPQKKTVEAVNLLSEDDAVQPSSLNVQLRPTEVNAAPSQVQDHPIGSPVHPIAIDFHEVPRLEAPPGTTIVGDTSPSAAPSLPSFEQQMQAKLEPFLLRGDVQYKLGDYQGALSEYDGGLKTINNEAACEWTKEILCRRASTKMQLGCYWDARRDFKSNFWDDFHSHRWLLMQILWFTCAEDTDIQEITKHAKALRQGTKRSILMLDPYRNVPSSDELQLINSSLATSLAKKKEANKVFQEGRYEQACEMYKGIIDYELREGCAPLGFLAKIHSNLGQSQATLGRFREGIVSCCIAMGLDPLFDKSAIRMSTWLQDMGFLKESMEVLQMALNESENLSSRSIFDLRKKVDELHARPGQNPQTLNVAKLFGLEGMIVFDNDRAREVKRTNHLLLHPDKRMIASSVPLSVGHRVGCRDGPSADRDAVNKRIGLWRGWAYSWITATWTKHGTPEDWLRIKPATVIPYSASDPPQGNQKQAPQGNRKQTPYHSRKPQGFGGRGNQYTKRKR